tara:strand:+ start:172 stop:294 length:123 start_codon:yes stop_codon:yes gene_type:complete
MENSNQLKKHWDYGYYRVKNGFIYYYDNDKNFERMKVINK